MSQLFTASPKHCAKKGIKIPRFNKKILYTITSFFFTALSLVFLIWFILHPSKPEFYLKGADVYQLSLSSPRLLNSTIQFTLVSKNPNTRVGVYYDELRAYASYKGQQITTDSAIPGFYQSHEETNLLSASLVGSSVPVAPSFGYEVGRDQTAGKLLLKLKLDGWLRWKIGTWVSGRYRVDVDCVTVISLGTAGDVSGPLTSKQGSQCSTNV